MPDMLSRRVQHCVAKWYTILKNYIKIIFPSKLNFGGKTVREMGSWVHFIVSVSMAFSPRCHLPESETYYTHIKLIKLWERVSMKLTSSFSWRCLSPSSALDSHDWHHNLKLSISSSSWRFLVSSSLLDDCKWRLPSKHWAKRLMSSSILVELWEKKHSCWYIPKTWYPECYMIIYKVSSHTKHCLSPLLLAKICILLIACPSIRVCMCYMLCVYLHRWSLKMGK